MTIVHDLKKAIESRDQEFENYVDDLIKKIEAIGNDKEISEFALSESHLNTKKSTTALAVVYKIASLKDGIKRNEFIKRSMDIYKNVLEQSIN